jgi:hypothetical protein
VPHVQPKMKTAKSPADLDAALEALASAGVNIRGIGGSDHEFDGEVALMVDDEALDAVRDALAPYDVRYLSEPDGLHLDYAHHDIGGLLAAVIRGRRHHEGGVVKDVVVGLDTMPFTLNPQDDDLVRDGDGIPAFDPNGRNIEAHPVQIHFLVTAKRGGDGRVIP